MITDKIYKHANVDSQLKIKKVYGSIAAMYKISEPKVYKINGDLDFDTIIVKIENLK